MAAGPILTFYAAPNTHTIQAKQYDLYCNVNNITSTNNFHKLRCKVVKIDIQESIILVCLLKFSIGGASKSYQKGKC